MDTAGGGRVRVVPGWVGVLAAALLIVGTGIGFGLAATGGGLDALDPLADRPHVTDADAGVSYGIPVGWVQVGEGPAALMTPEIFSSGIGTESATDEPGAVLAGLSVEQGSLAEIANRYPHLVTAFLTGADVGVDVGPTELVDLAGTTAVQCTARIETGYQEITVMEVYVFDGSRGVVVVVTAHVDGQRGPVEEITAVLASLRVI